MGAVGEERRPGDDTPDDRVRLTVPEAAHVLGISPEAVRNRLSRGTLESVKVEGTVYVLIDRDRARSINGIPNDIPGESAALISQMQGRIDSLEIQLERADERDRENRRIIAALTSRIPAIEAPQEATESSETGVEQQGRGRVPPEPQTAAQRPWWRRIIGG
jgi:hypothetical protein